MIFAFKIKICFQKIATGECRWRRRNKLRQSKVLTSGGDAPGMNASNGAVVRRGHLSGLKVMGVRRGYSGLIEEDIQGDAGRADVSDTIEREASVLYTARCAEMRTPEGIKRAAEVCRKVRH